MTDQNNKKDTAETASESKNSKQIILQSSQAVKPYNQEQIELIKNTVAKGATNDELKLFMVVANKTGLDPFTKQIHFVKRKVWNKQTNGYDEVGTHQVGIDGFRTIAERTGSYAGNDDPTFDNEKMPKKATVTVYKIVQGVRCPFTATARWEQYYPGEKQGFMWNKMPHLMLGKCAEALALRKAFPNDLSGLYTHEEMQQADKGFVEAAEVTKTVTAPAEITQKVEQKPVEQKMTVLGEKIKGEIEVCFTKEELSFLGSGINEAKKEKKISDYDWQIIKPIYLKKLEELTKNKNGTKENVLKAGN